MDDTAILDYLQDSYTMRRGMPTDIQIGSVFCTLGIRPGTLREILIEAIEKDRARQIDRVTKQLERMP